MWAQIIKGRIEQGKEEEMKRLSDEMAQRMANRPGLLHALNMRNQNDPQEFYTVLVFESEELAREGERALQQDGAPRRLQSVMAGPPEFVDLDVMRSYDR